MRSTERHLAGRWSRPFLALLCAFLLHQPAAASGQELGGLIFVPHDRLNEALGNPPERPSERAVSMFINEVVFNPAFPAAELEAAGFELDAFIGPNTWTLGQLLNRVTQAIGNGADVIHFEENVLFGGLTTSTGAFDVGKWSAVWDAVRAAEDPADPVVLGITEAFSQDLKAALDAILAGPHPEQLPDFGALEWYNGPGINWNLGTSAAGPWPTFDSFRQAMAAIGVKSGMWVGDFAGRDTYPSRLLETYYKTEFTFILANASFPWDTPDPGSPDEPPIKGEIDEITDSKTIVRRGDATEVAVLDDDGNVVLGGAVLSEPYAKQIESFSVRDELGRTVGALIDADGDLWAAGGVSVGQLSRFLRQTAAANDALEIENDAGEPVVVITRSGAVFARGVLIEHADPLTLD